MNGSRSEQKDAGRLSCDDYVVDEHAVAEAILGRMVRGELPRSAMLVSGKPGDASAIGAGEGGSAAGPGLT